MFLSLTHGPELAGDRLQQAPSCFAFGIGVHVDGSPLPVTPRGRHDDFVVRDLVAPRYDLDEINGY